MFQWPRSVGPRKKSMERGERRDLVSAVVTDVGWSKSDM